MKIINVLFAALFCPFWLFAQPDLEAGIFLGISNYNGDFTLNTLPEFGESNLAAGAVIRHPLSPVHGLRANLFYGKLTGNDSNFEVREQRESSFQTTFFELSVVGEWEPFGENRTDLTLDLGQRISPFFFAGVGLTYINPKPVFGRVEEEKAAQDLNAGFSKLQPSIPVGVGLRSGINEMMSLSFELGMRKVFTDYLDGVSLAGRPGNNDWYLFGGFVFLYKAW